MTPLHIPTPLIHSQYLKNITQQDVYFKLECLQPPGSFKLRGIGALCQEMQASGFKAFVASSGGNAGVAVAYAGMKLGVPTTVFIPTTSHAIFIRAIESYGANVVVTGDVWDETHQAALAYATHHNAAYIPPFDHPTIWQGHATLVPEMVLQGLNKPDAIVLSVGGGGLACGVLQGMHDVGWDDVPLFAVETAGADSFAASVKAGALVTLPAITSQATSLGAKRVTQKLMDWTKQHAIHSIVVSDEEALQATVDFAKDKRLLVEISSGASLAVVYHPHEMLRDMQQIVVIVCGGINTTHFFK